MSERARGAQLDAVGVAFVGDHELGEVAVADDTAIGAGGAAGAIGGAAAGAAARGGGTWAHINPYGTFHIDMNTHLDFGPGNTPTAKAA